MEGVMMKAPTGIAVAVRKDGEIVTKYDGFVSAAKKHKFLGLPVMRGVVMFVESLSVGMKTLTYSADVLGLEDEKPSKFEEFLAKKTGKSAMNIMMGFAVVVAVVLALGIFVIAPNVLANFLRPLIPNPLVMNIIEGAVRIIIFLAYVVSISAMKDIRRVYMYHGAEHKVIRCFEDEAELTVENARTRTRLHPRCGTNYLLLVVVVSILVFSLLGWSGNPFLRVLIRLAFMPIVAGLAYELLKVADKSDSALCRAIRFPGLMLQKLTTREPEDDMIEVAIAAFELATDPEAYAKAHAKPGTEHEGEAAVEEMPVETDKEPAGESAEADAEAAGGDAAV